MILSFEKTIKILKKYKIPICQTRIFKNKKKALLFSKRIGFPVVLKIFSKKIVHKTEKKGVIKDIKNETNFSKAWKNLSKIRNIDGILVQKQINGIEVIVGMKRDKIFGPVILFGTGGIFTEILKDISIGISPLNKKEIKELINKTKINKLLEGYRNFPKIKKEKLINLIFNLSKLSLKEKEIKEIDLNPVICNKNNVLAVDFKFLV